jgi:hypothetical protein
MAKGERMELAHKVFLAFIVLVTIPAVVVMAVFGYGYYATPVHLRPFRPDHEQLKASAPYSHGLGILGTTMIIVGVSAYSARKRLRSFWSLGNLSGWLTFHIFLCLVGPILVIFHSTFKAGGVAAISLWTMVSVWLSGMMGRFLYLQIPRNLQGVELSPVQVKEQLTRLAVDISASGVGRELIQQIDRRFTLVKQPDSLFETFRTFLHLSSIRGELYHVTHDTLAKAGLPRATASRLSKVVHERITLYRKSVVLAQIQKLFHYWHVIHLPFSVIMFITLAAHVTVTILLGYSWIF